MEWTRAVRSTVRMRRDQGLRQHLAAEDALPRLLLRRAHENVLVGPGALQLTEVQEFDERGGGVLGGQAPAIRLRLQSWFDSRRRPGTAQQRRSR